jgi:hypothetical protein
MSDVMDKDFVVLCIAFWDNLEEHLVQPPDILTCTTRLERSVVRSMSDVMDLDFLVINNVHCILGQ